MRAALRMLVICLAGLAAAACGRTPPAPTPAPSPVPTEVPFAVPDLTAILLDRGQLPARANAASATDAPHPSLAGLPVPEAFFGVLYAQGSAFAGRIAVFVYAHPEELDAAWPLLLERIVTPREIQGPGELAAVDHSDIAFIRCTTLVHIKLVGADPEELIVFAESLDARLEPLVCP